MLATICIPSDTWEANEGTVAANTTADAAAAAPVARRRLLETDCGEGRSLMFLETDIKKAHLLLFTLAIVHIIYTTTSLFSCLAWVSRSLSPSFCPCFAAQFAASVYLMTSPFKTLCQNWSAIV